MAGGPKKDHSSVHESLLPLIFLFLLILSLLPTRTQTTSELEPIESRLECVNSMDLPELQRPVEDGFQPDNIDLCAMTTPVS
jgi:hypothetical protein